MTHGEVDSVIVADIWQEHQSCQLEEDNQHSEKQEEALQVCSASQEGEPHSH